MSSVSVQGSVDQTNAMFHSVFSEDLEEDAAMKGHIKKKTLVSMPLCAASSAANLESYSN